MVSKTHRFFFLTIALIFIFYCSSQGDKPRFSNLSQSKGENLERSKVQKRPHISNPVNNEEFPIDDETINQIQYDKMLEGQILMDNINQDIQEELFLEDVFNQIW